MGTTVLVPTEGSSRSVKALEIALTDYPDAEIIVLHVMDPIGSGESLIDVLRPSFRDGAPAGSVSPDYWRSWREQAEERAERVFEESRQLAADIGVEVETVLEFGEPADIIIELVEDRDIDRVVMGSNCRTGAERLFLGSVAETVVRRSTVPVMIVR